MEKQIYLDNKPTNFYMDENGRLHNVKTGNWLQGGINKGYHLYNLHYCGKQYTIYTHRKVAELFLPNPNNFPIVHHKDGNKLNNRVDNLEWISAEDHAKEHLTNNLNAVNNPIVANDINWSELKNIPNTPYFLSLDGHVYNKNTSRQLREEKNGNYRRVQLYYSYGGKHVSIHRLMWEIFNETIPEGYEIDHIDRNPANNALSNLRLVTHSENAKNANHKNIKVYTINVETGEKTQYNSISECSKAVLGYRDGRKIPQLIQTQNEFKGLLFKEGTFID